MAKASILREKLLSILPLVEDETTNTSGMSMSEITRRLAMHMAEVPSDRHIRRALLDMTDAFGSVGSTRSTKWYRTISRPQAEISNMTVNVAMAINAVRRVAAHHLPGVVWEDLEKTFHIADRYLASHSGSPDSERGQAWSRKTLRIDGSQPVVLPKVDPGVYKAVTEALFYDRQLVFSNRPFGEEQPSARTYTMTPLALVDRAGVLYLVAWGSRRPGQRFLFRMDRLSNVRISEQAGEPDPTFDLHDYVMNEEALNFGSDDDIEIQLFVCEPLRTDGKPRRHPLREFRLCEDQLAEDADGGFLLRAKVKPSVMLWQLLHSHASSVEVIAPDWIRRRFRDEALMLAERYR